MSIDFKQLHQQWLALQVRAGWELKSAAHLREKRFEEFVPTYQEKRRWSDRTKTVTVPMFTGYVFVRFDLHNPLRIISVPGAIRFVSVGDRPIPIEESEIASLQILQSVGATCTPCDYLEIGEKVRIRGGALEGMQGIVTRLKGQDRLVVSVALLRRSISIEVDGANVDSLQRQTCRRCNQTHSLSA